MRTTTQAPRATPAPHDTPVTGQQNRRSQTPSADFAEALANDAATPDSDAWAAVIAEIYPHASERGITIVGPEIMSLDKMAAIDYITSKPIADDNST